MVCSRPLAASAALLLSVACAQAETEWTPGPQVTVCLNGAGPDGHSGNLVMSELCDELPGLVRPCSEDGCDKSTFRFSDVDPALEALVEATARNDADGLRTTVAIVGYSWGAVNAADLADRFAHDDRVPLSDRAIDRLVTIDAFSLPIPESIDISVFVQHAWNYRHSVAPEDTCANRPGIGAYTGRKAICQSDTMCRSHDFSLTDAKDDIDHCTVTDASKAAAYRNIVFGLDGDDELVLAAREP